MACPQLLASLAAFVTDAARDLAEVEVVVCGATDLCHPKLDDRFEENRGIEGTWPMFDVLKSRRCSVSVLFAASVTK